MRQEQRRGVTRDNNAVVVLIQALGPGALPKNSRQEFFDELGIDPPPESGRFFRDIKDQRLAREGSAWLKELGWRPPPHEGDDGAQGEQPEEDVWLADDRCQRAFVSWASQFQSRAWRREDCPPLGRWVKQNEQALDLAVQASQRSHFCMPLVLEDGATGPPLLSVDMSTLQGIRNIARGLAIRAMLRVGEGQYREACDDLLACRRLAIHAGRCPFVIGSLVAMGVHTLGMEGYAAVFDDRRAPAEIDRHIAQDIAAVGAAPDFSSRVVHDDRILVLGNVAQLIREIRGTVPQTDGDTKGARLVRYDWNVVFRRFNEWYDFWKRIYAEKDPERKQRLSEEFSKFDEYYTSVADDWKLFLWGYVSMRARSELMFARTYMFVSPYGPIFGFARRFEAEVAVTKTAAALADFRAQAGAYPANITALAPRYLDQVPVDPCGDQPLHYEVCGDGYVLYSVGLDGEDDKGTDFRGMIVNGEWVEQEDQRGDDIVLRIPLPRPTPPQSASP